MVSKRKTECSKTGQIFNNHSLCTNRYAKSMASNTFSTMRLAGVTYPKVAQQLSITHHNSLAASRLTHLPNSGVSVK